jgi:hypothetical protein
MPPGGGGVVHPSYVETHDSTHLHAKFGVWTWLCQLQVDKTFGSSPELKIKQFRIPKGWTITVDSRTPHGGAPRIGPEALRLHICAVVRAVDAVAAHTNDLGCAAIQDATIDPQPSAYLPKVHSAQRQNAAAFGRIQI